MQFANVEGIQLRLPIYGLINYLFNSLLSGHEGECNKSKITLQSEIEKL